jgi:hypothetical protein
MGKIVSVYEHFWVTNGLQEQIKFVNRGSPVLIKSQHIWQNANKIPNTVS